MNNQSKMNVREETKREGRREEEEWRRQKENQAETPWRGKSEIKDSFGLTDACQHRRSILF
jgi:hypothetical protein